MRRAMRPRLAGSPEPCPRHDRRVFAGAVGPQLVTCTMDLWQLYLLVATFLARAAVAAVSAVVLVRVRDLGPALDEAAIPSGT